MIERNKRHGHFLWICRYLGQEQPDLAGRVRMLESGRTIKVDCHTIKLVILKNTPDGRLYVLDVYSADGKLIRRSPCYIDPPKRGGGNNISISNNISNSNSNSRRRVRMVAEITGVTLLVGMTLGGVGVAYLFGDELADTLMVQESCKILRFDVFDVNQDNVYYVVEVQNSSTDTREFDVHLKAEGQDWENPAGPQDIIEFGTHTWSSTQKFSDPVNEKSGYLVEAFASEGGALCTAKSTSR